MIKIAQGNLLRADVEALVNTVNCDGFMGKGIALQFKRAFPENFTVYQRDCRAGQVKPGSMLTVATGSMVNPAYIINFPTKLHWRERSRMEDIRTGLEALVAEIRRLGIRSIAIPPLGCGNGGLDWRVVKPLILSAVSQLPAVEFHIFEPVGAPAPADMPVGTARPKMTPGRAAIIKLMERYSALDYRRTLLEIQKLAYFMQEAGEPLQLRFVAATYGPYADNLNKVLERLQGHFLNGVGDRVSPDVEIELMPNAAEEADAFLAAAPESTRHHLDRVTKLISGFESPYGMELLSSAHWAATRIGAPTDVSAIITQRVHAWNDRKRSVLKPQHIRIAVDRLREERWLKPDAEK